MSGAPNSIGVVVVGAGHLGSYHMAKISALSGAHLVGVVDTDEGQLAKAKAQHPNIACASHLEAFGGKAQGAIIAAPTTVHLPLAVDAIRLGMDVLVEKPIAPTTSEAQTLCDVAAEHGRIVQVGHTERFNPAIAAALQVADRPRYIVSERLGPFTGRSTDVDVVLDLMIHDLDIVASLVPAELQEVRAIGVPVLTDAIDMASARLAFADGTVAQLSAGRASLEPVRKLRLFTVERYVSIDCAARDVKSVRRLPADPTTGVPQLTGEPVEVPDGDALALQDAAFVECIRERKKPRVDGAAGLRALALAEAVTTAMETPWP